MRGNSKVAEFQRQSVDLICADWLNENKYGYISQFNNSIYYLLKYDELDRFDYFLSKLSEHNISIKGKIFAVDISIEKTYLGNEEIEKLLKVREFLRENGADLQVYESSKTYSLECSIIAKDEIDKIVKKINNATLPTDNNRSLNELEKFMWAYLFVANRQYHENPNEPAASRDITSILTDGKNVVCIGYAKLLKELCVRLNIECYINHCEVSDLHDKSKIVKHSNNIVIIDNTPLYCDACWDAISKIYKYPTIGFCLLSKEVVDKELDIVSTTETPYLDVKGDLRLAKKYLKELEKEENSDSYFKYITNPLMAKYTDIKIDEVDDNKHIFYNFFNQVIKKLQTYNKSKMLSSQKMWSALANVYLASGEIKEQDLLEQKKKAYKLADKTFDNSNKRTNGMFFDVLHEHAGLVNIDME